MAMEPASWAFATVPGRVPVPVTPQKQALGAFATAQRGSFFDGVALTTALGNAAVLATTVVAAAAVKSRASRPRANRIARRFFGKERESSKENEERWEKQREEERAKDDDEAGGLNEVEKELQAEAEEEERLKEQQAEDEAEQKRIKAAQERIQIEIDEFEKELEEKMANAKRLQTEYDNLRRRCRQELSAARKKAAVPMVDELLEIPDTYTLAKDNTKVETEGEQAVVDKFEALFAKMLSTWNDVGAHKVEALGKPFDPQVHEAVAMIPSTDYKEDIVCNELRAGWVLKSDDDDEDAPPQVLRPSLVTVSAGPGP